MSKTRYLHIIFSDPMQDYNIPKFRAAVIVKLKRESTLLHNHIDDNSFICRYPMKQYKVTNKKASMVCLTAETDQIHYLQAQKKFDFRIGKETLDYEIVDVRLKYERIQTWDTTFRYYILNWMALNQDNHWEYQNIVSQIERIQFLEQLLEKHIRIFMEVMGAEETIPLKLNLQEIKGEKHFEYENIVCLTFSINFTCNLSIPNNIGLGILKQLGDMQTHKINKYEKAKN